MEDDFKSGRISYDSYYRRLAVTHYGGDVEKAIRDLADSVVMVFEEGRKIPELMRFHRVFKELQEDLKAQRERAKRAREKKRRALQEEEKQLEKERAKRDELSTIPSDFDMKLLEKTSAGYEGVHAHGNGYRAWVRNPKGRGHGSRYLETRLTPERAAYDRYLFHRENKMPYTPWEVYVCGKDGTMDQFEANEGPKWICAVLGGDVWDIMPDNPPESISIDPFYYRPKAQLMDQPPLTEEVSRLMNVDEITAEVRRKAKERAAGAADH